MKALPPLDPTIPMADAARAVIGHHIARLRHELERVDGLTAADDQAREPVHQVRVISRRLSAALRVFAEYLVPKRSRKRKGRLRRLRRLAAPVRTLDVLILEVERSTSDGTAEHQANLEAFQHWLVAKRDRRRRELARSLAGKANKYARLPRPKDFRHAGNTTLAGAMAQALEQPARRVLQANVSLDFAELHRLRIAGKRLRYSLEIFASCQEPNLFSPAQACVEAMQKRLGDINDCHEFAAWMRRLAGKGTHPQRADAACWLAERFEAQRLEQSRVFQEEWTRSFHPILEHWYATLRGGPLSSAKRRDPLV